MDRPEERSSEEQAKKYLVFSFSCGGVSSSLAAIAIKTNAARMKKSGMRLMIDMFVDCSIEMGWRKGSDGGCGLWVVEGARRWVLSGLILIALSNTSSRAAKHTCHHNIKTLSMYYYCPRKKQKKVKKGGEGSYFINIFIIGSQERYKLWGTLCPAKFNAQGNNKQAQ